MPVPDHLKPVKAQYCQEVKREMEKLWLAMRQAAQASSEDEMPSYKPAKAKDEEEDKDSRRSPSVNSSFSSEPARGSRAHRSPSPAKGLKREWRERSCERRERSSSSSTHPARVWRGTPSRPKEAGALLPVTEEEEKPEKALVKTKTEKTQEPEKATKTEDTEEPEKADEEERKKEEKEKIKSLRGARGCS